MAVVRKFTGAGDDFSWESVVSEGYEDGQKFVLAGTQDGIRNLSMRYFEIPPGGKSSLDSHEHDHGVMILRGTAHVLLGDEFTDVEYGDVIYIEPFEKHQFENTGEEPLGFLCVTPAKD